MNDLHTWNHRPLLEGRIRAWQLHLSNQKKKKRTEKPTELSMRNLTLTRESRQARQLQKVTNSHFLGNQSGIAGVHDFIFIIVIF